MVMIRVVARLSSGTHVHEVTFYTGITSWEGCVSFCTLIAFFTNNITVTGTSSIFIARVVHWTVSVTHTSCKDMSSNMKKEQTEFWCISYILEYALFKLFLNKIFPYSSWGLGVHMKLLGANDFDGTSKPTEYSAPQFLLYTAVIRNREKWKNWKKLVCIDGIHYFLSYTSCSIKRQL